MTHSRAITALVPFKTGSLERQPVAVLAITFLADWLFFNHGLGISCAIFAAAVCLAAATTNKQAGQTQVWLACAIAVAGLVPVVEQVGILSLLICALSVIAFALIATGHQGESLTQALSNAGRLMFAGPFRLLPDLFLSKRLMRRSRRGTDRQGLAAGWLVPVFFGAVFLLLFTAANPLIEQVITSFEFLPETDGIGFYRVVFWLIVSSVTWPYIRVRFSKRKRIEYSAPVAEAGPHEATPVPAAKRRAESERLFNTASVRRSLLLFNALFAVQTALDIVFLWGGADLPAGTTYAEYAHRGAYPLIATALLAAVFVLIAMRPASATESAQAIRTLVYLWVGQNILLVISAIHRLELYVDIYALTELRVAAFIWMGLVAAGLALIVARIVFQRSNEWLVAANLATLMTVLYASSFVNFTHLIAGYNVDHSFEVAGKGVSLDTKYLVQLGAMSLPALDRFIAHQRSRSEKVAPYLLGSRDRLSYEHRRRSASNWRHWTFRDWRLVQYLRRPRSVAQISP